MSKQKYRFRPRNKVSHEFISIGCLPNLQQRAVFSFNKRNVTRNFKTCSQLWQILIQAKMCPIKEKENRQLLL